MGDDNMWYVDKALGGGNYCNDHTTPDNDNDGFVDTPKNIYGLALQKDMYPLTSPTCIFYVPDIPDQLREGGAVEIDHVDKRTTYDILTEREQEEIFSEPIISPSPKYIFGFVVFMGFSSLLIVVIAIDIINGTKKGDGKL